MTMSPRFLESPRERNRADSEGTFLPNGKVQLIFGHNRLAAHKLLGGKDARYKLMPVEIVAEVPTRRCYTHDRRQVPRHTRKFNQIHIIETAKKLNCTSEAIGEKLLNMSGAAVRTLWRLKNLSPAISLWLMMGGSPRWLPAKS